MFIPMFKVRSKSILTKIAWKSENLRTADNNLTTLYSALSIFRLGLKMGVANLNTLAWNQSVAYSHRNCK